MAIGQRLSRVGLSDRTGPTSECDMEEKNQREQGVQ